MTYPEQLKSPMWQKKRLQIFERDKFTCQICLDTETQLQVHHKTYDKKYQTLAWEYPDYVYQTLCADCHKAITEHLKEFDNDKEFNALKIKNPGTKVHVVYTNGRLILNANDIEKVRLSENSANEIVQFLINNWLKNG
jgi:5-methylcytosine-specific restriction endonuclease McrA